MSSTPFADADGVAKAWLEFGDGQHWSLRGNCHLGRAPDNEIVIDHPKASRQHAAIHTQNETEFWLLDLGSRNGTYLNERRLIRPTQLRHHDRLNVGGQAFTFHQPAGFTSRAGEALTEGVFSSTIMGTATVLDLRGASLECGLPDEDRKWNLHGAACTRIETFTDEAVKEEAE